MREEAVYAYRFEGKRYDCGSKLGYLQATVEYALGHPPLGRDFRVPAEPQSRRRSIVPPAALASEPKGAPSAGSASGAAIGSAIEPAGRTARASGPAARERHGF